MILKENKILAKHDVMTYYDLIIRNPWEEEKDLEEALDLIHELQRPFYLKIYTLAYYPKHPITTRALKEKKVDPNYKAQKASGYTRIERQKIRRAGQRLVKDIQKGKEKPISNYNPGV